MREVQGTLNGEIKGTLNGGGNTAWGKWKEHWMREVQGLLWMGRIKGTLNGGGNTAWGKWKEHWMRKVQVT